MSVIVRATDPEDPPDVHDEVEIENDYVIICHGTAAESVVVNDDGSHTITVTFDNTPHGAQNVQVEQLAQWKREATEVIKGWDEVWSLMKPTPRQLGMPQSAIVANEIQALRADIQGHAAETAALRSRIAELLSDKHERPSDESGT